MIVSGEEIGQFEKRYRANLINSILGYKPANLIGTKSVEGINNLAIFTSTVHLGANPPLIGMVSRPDSVPRHTLTNIRNTSHYTINHLHKEIYKAGHQTSAKYSATVSEFTQTDLTPVSINGFPAPFVDQSEVKMGLELVEIIPIKQNGTYFIIGEIKLIEIDHSLLLEDGSLDYSLLTTVTATGLDTYHEARFIDKLPYARPQSTK
ncbi:flavin reductase family protein [Portibacter marinus]|uniref:flavin reductase family protein n=1 Tax=Portibacter marinus TaxID=2898660 RepID=UPI001F3ADA97|nr:flavin reductase [Portibacter marinus]